MTSLKLTDNDEQEDDTGDNSNCQEHVEEITSNQVHLVLLILVMNHGNRYHEAQSNSKLEKGHSFNSKMRNYLKKAIY